MDATRFVLILALLLLLATACLAPVQNDTFWQLRAGMDTVTDGRIPLVDTYSHTVAGQPWPNHSWLWQVGAYATFAVGGLATLTAVSATLATLAVLVVYRTMPATGEVRVLLILLAFPMLVATYAVRPQVAATLLFSALLWLILNERYMWIPLLFLLWANVHGSVVIGGLALAAASVVAAVLQALSPTLGNRSRTRALAITTVASAAATLVNPLGIALWSLTATSVTKARGSGVMEFEPAWRWGWVGAYFIAWSAVVALSLVARRRTLAGFRDWVAAGIALAVLPTGLLAGRNMGWAALASLPVMAALAGHAPPGQSNALRRRHWAFLPLVAGLGIVSAIGVARVWIMPSNSLGWAPMGAEIAQAISRCPGPLYNTYNQGGYVIWRVPSVPVFIDSRYDPFPAALIQRHAAIEASADYQSTFAKYGIACAALPPRSATARALARDGWLAQARDGDWVVLYGSGAGSRTP